MSSYYLIARNKSDNSFQIIDINEQWYLGANGHDIFSRANGLEAIDLVTSQFSSREHLVGRLYRNGYVDSGNIDLFIASKNTKNGKNYIKFNEVIYSGRQNRRINEFKKIAMASLHGNMYTAGSALAKVYDDIIFTMYSSSDLFEIVMSGQTNMPQRFTNLLKDVPKYDDIPYDLKCDRFFKTDSYEGCRNIVEALNRFDLISDSSRQDRIISHEAFIEENEADRMVLVPELSIRLDKNYCEGQISFFEDSDIEKIRSAAKAVAKSESKLVKKEDKSSRKLSLAEKQQEIFDTLRTLPTNAFMPGGKGYKVNYGVFKHPLLDEEKEQLDSLLTGNMAKFFMNYAVHYYRLQEACKYSTSSSSEIAELREDLQWDLASIKRRFRSSNCINNTYDWCMLWRACRKRDAEYSASGFAVGTGDVDAKVFGKKH